MKREREGDEKPWSPGKRRTGLLAPSGEAEGGNATRLMSISGLGKRSCFPGLSQRKRPRDMRGLGRESRGLGGLGHPRLNQKTQQSVLGSDLGQRANEKNGARYVCRRTRFVSASPHEGQTKTCSWGFAPRHGTLRISFITWPHPTQTVNGRLSGKRAMNHLSGRDHPIPRRANVFARSVRACGKVSARVAHWSPPEAVSEPPSPKEGTVPIATPSPR
jgi:hypothetical protein